jgi:hypothetical protein
MRARAAAVVVVDPLSKAWSSGDSLAPLLRRVGRMVEPGSARDSSQ